MLWFREMTIMARSYIKMIIRNVRSKRGNIFLALIILVLMFTLTSLILQQNGSHLKDANFIRTFPNEHFQKKNVKRILLWSPHLGSAPADVENENNVLKTCPVKCFVTNDKNDIANVDAVDFTLYYLWVGKWIPGSRSIIQFPKYRKPHQVWIVSNLEPPQNLYGDLVIFNGMFNWTRWYRSDSTVLWPYGYRYELNEIERNQTTDMMKRNFFKEKTNGIVGRISNCVAPSNRLQLVKELRKYLEIDMQGKCYKNVCGRPGHWSDTQCNSIIKQYKFFLALENNHCTDYVTEKYWHAIDREQIPIVNWKDTNKNIVLPGSYINLYDFKDIRSAAEYIRRVGENETLYNSFFKWKAKYTNRVLSTSCETCKALHDEERPGQVIENLDGWIRNDICEKLGVSQLTSLFKGTIHADYSLRLLSAHH